MKPKGESRKKQENEPSISVMTVLSTENCLIFTMKRARRRDKSLRSTLRERKDLKSERRFLSNEQYSWRED